MCSMDPLEDIKSRLSIEDVVSEYVQLKRSGRNFKGLSPWTNEKTPSFMVSPEKQIWHDFSSARGGNMFSFVMEMEGLDFRGAMELLARKAGIDLSQYQTGRSADNRKLKERLYEVLEQAAKFYQAHFSKNSQALEYIFKKRGYTKDTVLTFRLGYSPNNGSALYDYLKKQNFTDEEIQKAGLLSRGYKGKGDMFRGRIMVPLMDQQGRIIGFTARLLGDDPDAPKYINTPQTLLYDKGRHVFGLHLAKTAIREHKFVVAVEGNLDVIASYQAGVRNVVATAGTAMTESHLKTLGRFTHDVRLAFDQDQAGLSAAERAIPIAGKVDVTLSIITIPEGKDPDELVKKAPKAWEKVITEPQYALDWLIERYQSQLDIDSAEGKRRFSDELLKVVRQLPDPVEQDHYLQKLAEIAGVSSDAMRSKLKSPKPTTVLKRHKLESVESTLDPEIIKNQDHLLALALYVPIIRAFLEGLTDEMFLQDTSKQLLKFLLNNPDYDGQAKPKELKQIADYIKVLGLQYETLYQDLDELELGYEAKRLRTRLVERYVRTKKAAITAELQNADEKRTKELLEEARALDLLLKLHPSKA